MNKKYQIFISSTYKDLKPARRKVTETILSMGHFPVGMEMFGASDDEQWKIIKETIDTSDYYLVIIGKCLGTIVPGEEISYTQKEFRYALEKKIPVIGFIMSDEGEPAKTYQETDPIRIEKLNSFKKELETGRTTDYWTTTDNLATRVAISLPKEMKKHPMIGWTRGEDNNIKNKCECIISSTTDISIESKVMLFYASEEGNIIVSKTMSGDEYIAGNHPLNATNELREQAKWCEALDELIKAGYVKCVNQNDYIYQVTAKGYKKSDSLKKEYGIESNLSQSELIALLNNN